MSRKEAVIFPLLLAGVFAFFLLVLFGHGRLAGKNAGSGGQAGERSTAGKEQAAGKVKTANEDLKAVLDDLRRDYAVLQDKYEKIVQEKKDLSDQLAAQDIDQKAMVPLKQRIKDVSCMIDNIEGHAQASEHLGNLLDSIYGELSSIESSMTMISRDEPLYKQKLEEKENLLQARTEEIEKLRGNIAGLEKRLKQQTRLYRSVKKYKDQFSALQNERNDLRRKIDEDKETIIDLRASLKALEGERQMFSRAGKETGRQMEEYAACLAALTAEKEALNSRLAGQEEETAALSKKIIALEKENTAYAREKDDFDAEVLRYGSTVREMQQKISVQERDLAEYRGYKEKYDSLRAAHDSLVKKAGEDKKVLERLSAQVKTLEAEKKSASAGEGEYLKKIYSYEDRLAALSREKEQAEKELGLQALESERLKNMLAALREDNSRYIEGNKSLEDTISGYRGQIIRLEAGLKEKEQALAGLDGYKEELLVLSARYSDLEARAESDKQALNALRAQAELLDKERDEFLAREKEARGKIDSFQALLGQLSREKEGLAGKIDSLSVEVASLTGKLRTVTEERDSFLKEKTGLEEKIIDDAATIAALRKELEALTLSSAGISKENQAVSAELLRLEEENRLLAEGKDALESEKAAKARELENKTVYLSSLEKDLALARVEYERATAQYEQASQTIERIGLDLAKRADKIVELQDLLEKKSIELTGVKSELEVKLREMALLREDMVKIKLDNSRLANDIEDKDASLVYLRQEIGRISDMNSQFRASLHRVSNVIEEKESDFASGEGEVNFVSDQPDPEEQVDVKIESVLPEVGGN